MCLTRRRQDRAEEAPTKIYPKSAHINITNSSIERFAMIQFRCPNDTLSIITTYRAGTNTLREELVTQRNYIETDFSVDFLTTEHSAVILRHPVSRLWSAWKFTRKVTGIEKDQVELMLQHTLPYIETILLHCEKMQDFPYIIPFSAMSDYFPTVYGLPTGPECMDYDDQALHLIRKYNIQGIDNEISAYETMVNRCEILPLELLQGFTTASLPLSDKSNSHQ